MSKKPSSTRMKLPLSLRVMVKEFRTMSDAELSQIASMAMKKDGKILTGSFYIVKRSEERAVVHFFRSSNKRLAVVEFTDTR
jgi:hypothetical protein